MKMKPPAALFKNKIFSFDVTKFPKILESIKVVDNLHVKLRNNGEPLPLPQWFVQSHNVTMKKEVI